MGRATGRARRGTQGARRNPGGGILAEPVGEAGHGGEPAPVDGEGEHAVEGRGLPINGTGGRPGGAPGPLILAHLVGGERGGPRVSSEIGQRYERRSLVVTTNLPFARWSEVFLDATAAAAVIDRIVHHATVLTTAGDSHRLKTATRNQASARHRR